MRPYYLGIDVSKGYADLVIMDEHKLTIEENFQLDDTFKGHCHLHEILDLFFKSHPDSVLYAAVESTGGYENNWFDTLVNFQNSMNIHTARLNPLGVNANSKAGLKRNSTDKISAENVAEYMIAHPEKILYGQQDPFSSLRKQWSFVRMLTKQSTQLFNQLESLIYSAAPELIAYCKDGVPLWILRLLVKYPTSDKLSRARKTSVSKIPYITNDRAKTLIANAKKSIASADDNVTAQLISATAKQIISLKETVRLQEKLMAKQCAVPEVDPFMSFNGISYYSAIGLMLEIQTVKRFANVKKPASFFGIHPALEISGDGGKKACMSKMGRKAPRHILFMVALSAINCNPLIKDIYEQRLEKGMEKPAAIGYCMHKILRIIYGMLKHNMAFDPKIDSENREKKACSEKSGSEDKNRRYQNFDSDAPISGRQNKKRKERKLSH